MSDWRDVATAVLGSWPATVNSWKAQTLTAYVGQLEARGLTPDDAYAAILAWDGGDQIVPPSASQLAALARRDPDRPTSAEAIAWIFGPDGVLRARTKVSKARWEPGERDQLNDAAAWELATALHPLLFAFIRTQGLDRLRSLDLDDPEWGDRRRELLADDWDEFVEANEHREARALTSGRRGELGRFDPLRALGPQRLELERAS